MEVMVEVPLLLEKWKFLLVGILFQVRLTLQFSPDPCCHANCII